MTTTHGRLSLVSSTGFGGYELIDSGRGRKLERFGAIVVDRPEAQAIWQPVRPAAEWARAHAAFSASGEDEEKGRWRIDRPVPDAWPLVVDDASVDCTADVARAFPPEKAVNDALRRLIPKKVSSRATSPRRKRSGQRAAG